MWYALVQDEQLGPMPAHEVQQLFEQNVIVSETLVWRAGMNDWVALCQLPEFMHLFSEGDKTVAADFDTLFGELDDDDRTMLGEGLDDAPDLGAAVDALLSDAPAAAAPEAPIGAPDLPDDEMTIGAPAPPMLPKRPAPPSPFGKPKPPSPFGAKRPGLLAPKKAPPAPAPPSPPPATTEATMELGDGDLLADVLADAARGAAPPSPAPPSPAGGEGTMELGDADLFAGLLDEVGGVEEIDSIESLDEVEVIDEPVVPAAPIPPSPFAAAAQPPTGGGINFGAPQPPTGGGINFGAPQPPTGGGINFGATDAAAEAVGAAPAAPSPFSGGITSAAAEPPAKGKNKTVLLALLLVVLGGGLGAAVLMITSPGESPAEDAATAAPVVDAAQPEPDAAVPDAAPVPDATIDAAADAVVDAEVDAVVDAVVDAIVDAKPPPRVAPVRRRTTPRPPPQPKVTKKVMLSRDDIQGVVNGASGKLKGCASSVPAVKGKTVSVFVTINRSGRITRTRVTSASLRGTDAQGCVENTLKTLKFPEFTGDPMSFPLPIKL